MCRFHSSSRLISLYFYNFSNVIGARLEILELFYGKSSFLKKMEGSHKIILEFLDCVLNRENYQNITILILPVNIPHFIAKQILNLITFKRQLYINDMY